VGWNGFWFFCPPLFDSRPKIINYLFDRSTIIDKNKIKKAKVEILIKIKMKYDERNKVAKTLSNFV
jgi:hypothetical protein